MFWPPPSLPILAHDVDDWSSQTCKPCCVYQTQSASSSPCIWMRKASQDKLPLPLLCHRSKVHDHVLDLGKVYPILQVHTNCCSRNHSVSLLAQAIHPSRACGLSYQTDTCGIELSAPESRPTTVAFLRAPMTWPRRGAGARSTVLLPYVSCTTCNNNPHGESLSVDSTRTYQAIPGCLCLSTS